MLITFGIDVGEANDRYFHMIEGIATTAETIAAPGKFTVEALPSLSYLPPWFPGGGFKRYAANARAFLNASQNELYRATIDGLVSSIL